MQYSTTAGSCARDAGMNNCLGQILFLPQSPHDGQNSLQILLVHVLYGVHNLFRKDRIPVFGVLQYVKDFVVGHYGSFDELATKTVIDAKKRHPQVTLTLLLPYAFDRPESKPEGFDYVLYPDGLEKVPKRFAIIRANRYMIEHSSHLIAYVSHPSWGSRDILEAALRRQKRGLIKVTNLAGWYPHNMA